MTQPLYAKSKKAGRDQLTLFQHLLDTEQAVNLVFAPGSRWHQAWVRFFGIAEPEQEGFWKLLRVAALFHDVGKANRDFQTAVTERGRHTQAVRHEHLSALLLALPDIRAWLNPAVDIDVVLGAVLSHHIKAARKRDDVFAWCGGTASSVELYFDHEDVRGILRRVQVELDIGVPPPLPNGPWRAAGSPWIEALQNALQQSEHFRRALKKDPARRRRLAAAKAGVIAADAVASAIVREDLDMPTWLSENAHQPPISPAEIREAILLPRARQLQERTGRAFSLHKFQELLGTEGARSLLLAPCGAGKTLAAWEWAKQQAERHQFGRVIFLYPTRGTATEGFRDYVGWAPEGDAKLLHGSSAFELASMAENPPDSLQGKDLSEREAEARMFALGLWRARFFSATVDQFLAFLQNRYESLCLLPALADSAVILDEVHSYDPHMFDLLLTFLKEFDVPVLCMTATLPNHRRQKLREAGLVEFPRAEHSDLLTDLSAAACHPRYGVRFEPSAEAALAAGVKGFQDGKRVLIVVNRVARCIEVAEMVSAAIGQMPLVYHSRFRLMDRQKRHRDVVDAFKGSAAAIAVTTQVCEMSLDLDAQVLVSELAPVPSLIQRFGRANRYEKQPRDLADVIVYPPSQHAPYEREDIERAKSFISTIGSPASQALLAERLENERQTSDNSIDDAGAFLGSGYFAVPGSFREDDDFSVQCVCSKDLEQVEALIVAKEPIDGFLVPVPKRYVLDAERPALLPRHIEVADSVRYSESLGFRV